MTVPVTLFPLGNSGPKLKNTGTVIEVRNPSDNAMAIIRGLDPVGDTDLSTKLYVDTTAGNIGSRIIVRFPIALVNVSSTKIIPAGAVAVSAKLDIVTPYTVGATITIGFAATPTALMTAAMNNAQIAGLYNVNINYAWAVANVALVTIAGGPVAGAGFAIVEYCVPLT